MAVPQTNGVLMSATPIQLSLAMPGGGAPTRIFVHLTPHRHCTLLFLTSGGDSGQAAPCTMGSFVYAVPNRVAPSESPNCTTLYGSSAASSQGDFASRIAKILARRTAKPAYVGSSVSFSGAAGGGSVEEEMEGLRTVVDVVIGELKKAK